MKIRKSAIALSLCCIMALGVVCLAACGSGEKTITLKNLEAPTNVQIVYGDEDYSSEDDYVSFDEVENAVNYQVFVYQSGDTVAKVTSGTASPVEMPNDLDAGTYQVRVKAIGDQVNYNQSNGSEAVTYTVTERTVTKLGKATNISMDFTSANPDEAIYPTITFTGVDNALRYTVYMYSTDSSYTAPADGTTATTQFTVPASSSSSITYMMDSTNYGELTPGYYYVEIVARGDDDLYEDGDAANGTAAWVGYRYAVPEIESDGARAAITNREDYFAGTTQITFYAYADAACTDLLQTKTITYNSSTSFGQTSYTDSATFDYVETAAEASATDLVIGQTYYYKAEAVGDGTVFIGAVSDALEAVCDEPASSGSSGGFPGGDMGGGMGGGSDASWDINIAGMTFIVDLSEDEPDFVMGDNSVYSTAYLIRKATPSDGSVYSFTFGHRDSAAPFELDGYLELREDGTAEFHMSAAGPISEANFTGTWTEADGILTIVF